MMFGVRRICSFTRIFGVSPLSGKLIPSLSYPQRAGYCQKPVAETETSGPQHQEVHQAAVEEPQGQSTSDDQFSEEEPFGKFEDGEDSLRLEILNASLPFVHSHGWSAETLATGAETLGYSGMAHGMFSEGGVALVNHFYSSCNDDLQQILKDKVKDIEENPETKPGTTVFIRDACEVRLRMNIEYMDSWAHALALHANPTNAPKALHNIGTMLDHIWYHAGDRSTDFNWYTKRGFLGMVYKSTELCMLQDKSEDYKETWDFLDRRLADIHNAAKMFRDADHLAKDVKSLTQAGVITALNIFGMNSRSR